MALSYDIAPQEMSLAINKTFGIGLTLIDCTTSRLKGIQAQFLAYVYTLKILANQFFYLLEKTNQVRVNRFSDCNELS